MSVYRMQKEGAEADRLAEENRTLAERAASLEAQMQDLQKQLDALSGQAESLTAEKEELTAKLEDAQKKNCATRAADRILRHDSQYPRCLGHGNGGCGAAVSKPVYEAGTKLIALTFDDGPGKYTERLLDELKARGLHATFSWWGRTRSTIPPC